jgi:LmbE family N-acetylglucosaminyl deacetylase
MRWQKYIFVRFNTNQQIALLAMKFKSIVLLSVICALNGLPAKAQQFRPAPSSHIYKQLQQLQRMGTVMYIAAHPDDENTRLITYLVHHDHINTIYLSLTRGDGGQNIIGNEQGAALGLIRTNEMMMARKLDGGKQLFTRFIDFGFTKSPDETFNFWNKQDVVEDVKKAIQQYRPDVLICRFPTTGEGGHGQHTASAIAALEAFNQIQADKNPDTWKPKRILFNAFKFGTSNTIRPGQFELPINQFDPILGEAYGEIAGRSRSEHKSQGAGTPQSYGISNENFELLAGAPLATSLYDDIDTSWNRINQQQIGQEISGIIEAFQFNAPQKLLPQLLALKLKLSKIKADSFWVNQKIKDLDNIILQCAGLQIEVLSNKATCIYNQSLDLSINATARYPEVEIVHLKDTKGNALVSSITIENDKVWTTNAQIKVPSELGLTQPYWLQESARNNQFIYPAPYVNEPLSKNTFTIKAQVNIAGVPFDFEVPVSYKRLDPTRGDVIEAVRIMPILDIEPLASTITIEDGAPLQVSVAVNSRATVKNAVLEILDEKGNVLAQKDNLNFEAEERQNVTINLAPSTYKKLKNPSTIFFRIKVQDEAYQKQLHLIEYPHIPTLQYFSDASSKLILKNWKNEVKQIGYIVGAGDKVAESLSELGMQVTIINETELANHQNLSKYDAIVCGVRMANTRKDLQKYLPELWQYIEKGGTVIMQYNTSMGLVLNPFTPVPLTLSRDRVTDENAPIQVIKKDSKILNFPNKIKEEDFKGWIQERGVYFPSKWDDTYETSIAVNDPGEQALNSGILTAKMGQGYFVYTPLAFFRQLPAGNVGAIKLFINLLNIAK